MEIWNKYSFRYTRGQFEKQKIIYFYQLHALLPLIHVPHHWLTGWHSQLNREVAASSKSSVNPYWSPLSICNPVCWKRDVFTWRWGTRGNASGTLKGTTFQDLEHYFILKQTYIIVKKQNSQEFLQDPKRLKRNFMPVDCHYKVEMFCPVVPTTLGPNNGHPFLRFHWLHSSPSWKPNFPHFKDNSIQSLPLQNAEAQLHTSETWAPFSLATMTPGCLHSPHSCSPHQAPNSKVEFWTIQLPLNAWVSPTKLGKLNYTHLKGYNMEPRTELIFCPLKRNDKGSYPMGQSFNLSSTDLWEAWQVVLNPQAWPPPCVLLSFLVLTFLSQETELQISSTVPGPLSRLSWGFWLSR